MSGLSNWLQSLLIAVIFAICLEFVLPSQQLQRYVRTVMGLFILLLLLSPLFTLTKAGFQSEQWMNQLQSDLQSATTEAWTSQSTDASSNLSTILARSEHIQMIQHDQVIATTELQVAEEIKQHLQAKLPYSIEEIHVKLMHERQEKLKISSIELTLQEMLLATNDEHHDQPSTMQPISPVQPIQRIQAPSSSHTLPDYQHIKERYTAMISQQWDVHPSLISVYFQSHSPFPQLLDEVNP